MGACLSTAPSRDSGSRGVLLLGLDGAGATTILYQIVLGKRLETIPTLGVNHETIRANGLELECWDIGGLDKLRPLWRQYSKDADAVIFVIDSADEERMAMAASELASLYNRSAKKATVDNARPLLIFANKQDLPKACTGEEIEHILKLPTLPVNTYQIFPCNANDRQSLLKGITWLTDELKGQEPIQAGVSPADLS